MVGIAIVITMSLRKSRSWNFRFNTKPLSRARWHPIVRYDSTHGFGHRDLLHPDGSETKTTFRDWDYAQVLTYGERDLKQNWKIYRQNYMHGLADRETRT
jgi:hypothetical protein